MIIGIDASRAFVKKRSGTENYSYFLIRELAKLDKKNQYRLYLKRSQKIDFDLPANFWIKKIPWPRIWTQAGLAIECLLTPPDLLFIPAHTLPIVRRSSLPTVVTIHGLEYRYLPGYYRFPQKLYLTRSTEYAVSQATHLIAVSKWTKRQLVRQLKADSSKISVVYEGVDQNRFKVQNSKFKINRVLKKYKIKEPYILFVGVIQPRKNLVRLIEAFAELLNLSISKSLNLSLILAGSLGWMYDKIQEAPSRFGVSERVSFLGFVPDKDLPSLYSGALVFCLPSLVEGFGLPVLEAMACGTPVLAARTGALPELVGEAGLLVNPQKVQEIAQALRLLIENPELREGLREKGFRQVKKFSWEKTAKETIKIFYKYSKLLKVKN